MAYLNTLSSGNKRFIKNIRTKEYINILWYQHKEQGIKCMISEKNRLPRVDTKDIIKAKKT